MSVITELLFYLFILRSFLGLSMLHYQQSSKYYSFMPPHSKWMSLKTIGFFCKCLGVLIPFIYNCYFYLV